MFVSTLSIVIMSAASVLTLLFVVLLISGSKYSEMIEPLNNKEFPLFELYGVGFALLDLIRYDYGSRAERNRRRQIALLRGEKHAEYYLRVNAAERVTLTFLLLVVGFCMYGLVTDYLILVVFLMFAFTAYYYVATLPQTALENKSTQIISDFADVSSKLAVLVNAGMFLREAWEKVAESGDSELYQEMKRVCVQVRNGVSESTAYSEFGMRCSSQEIKKFTSMMVQGLTYSNSELGEMLRQQSREIWFAKRQRVKQQGEKAASKLLIPVCIIFIGILIMIIVPIFTNLGL